jgi:hypothetical protein
LQNWLKPHTLSSRVNKAVGFPWEITRAENLLPQQVIDVYSKDGGLPNYHSRMAVIDQYGLGFVALTANSGRTLPVVAEAILVTVVPAANKAVREQARKNGYTGRFTAEGKIRSWLNLEIDDGPGLKV